MYQHIIRNFYGLGEYSGLSEEIFCGEENSLKSMSTKSTPGSTCQGVGSRRVLLGRAPEKDKGDGGQESSSVLRH